MQRNAQEMACLALAVEAGVGRGSGRTWCWVGRWSRSYGIVLYPELQGEQQEVEEFSVLLQYFLEARVTERIVISRALRKRGGKPRASAEAGW